ncbi:MAG: metallophosphoesterase [bacterium]
MRIVAIGDMHGDLEPVYGIVASQKPDLLICCGDWGDPGSVDQEDFDKILQQAYTLTVFGNHDDLDLLPTIENSDGSRILITNGEIREFQGLRITGINGIWAKSHKKPWYVTDEDVGGIVAQLKGESIDILITHACPIGLADLTPAGTHGGQRCFLDAFKTIKPKLHLCGHLHRKSIRVLKDGSLVINIGFTKEGDFKVFDVADGRISLVN